MTVKILRMLLWLLSQVCSLHFVLCAPNNIALKTGDLMKLNKGRDDDDRDDDDEEPCEDFSDACGRKFYSIIGVIAGVVILALIITVVAVLVCMRRGRKAKSKVDTKRRSETPSASPKPVTPQLQVTPPPSMQEPSQNSNNSNTPQTSINAGPHGNQQQTKNRSSEGPSAPFDEDYENTRRIIRVDEPPPPYDFTVPDRIHSNSDQARRTKEREAMQS